MYPDDPCDDGDASTENDTLNDDRMCGNCDSRSGCIDETACNYDAAANTDDGSCAEFDDVAFVAVTVSQAVTATVTATNSTCCVCGGGCTADVDADGICDDVDDCVGALDACVIATVLVISRNGCEDIPEGDCDCNGTKRTQAYAVVIAQLTKTQMASVMTWMTVWVSSTLAAYAMALVPFSNVDVMTSPTGIAIVTVTNSTLWACVVAIAWTT